MGSSSGSSRRRRRHSQNAGGHPDQNSQTEEVRQHLGSRGPTHMNLLEILNHIQMGNQLSEHGLDELNLAD